MRYALCGFALPRQRIGGAVVGIACEQSVFIRLAVAMVVHKKAAICKLQTAAIVNDDPCLSSYPIQAGENFVQRIL